MRLEKNKYQRPNTFVQILAILFLMIGSGCLEEIELPIPKGFQQSIFIDAKVVAGNPAVFSMQLGQLFTFTSDSRGSINARDALLTDSDGNEMIIKQTGTGIYYYEFQEDDPVQIEVGKSYQVRVGTFDGRDFESTFEPLLPVPRIENVRVEKIGESQTLPNQTVRIDTIMRYTLDTDLTAPGEAGRSYLRWESDRVARITDTPITLGSESKTCYVSSRLGVLTNRIFDGPRQSSSRLDDHVVLDDPIGPFYAQGLYYTVIQESLSEGAYEYWQSVREVSEEVGDIFGSPPGKIKSNFVNVTNPEDEVFGYFYATQQDTARIFVLPQSVASRCPSPNMVNPDGSCRDRLCCDCTSVENSSALRPSFWIE